MTNKINNFKKKTPNNIPEETKTKLKQAGKDFSKAGKNAILTVFNTAKGTYNIADATDKFIENKTKNIEFSEESGKLKKGLEKTINFTKNNIIKLFLAGSIAYGGYKIADKITGGGNYNIKNKKELVSKQRNESINSKESFIKFLQNTDLKSINRENELGRYLRVLRYDKEIKKFSQKDSIGYENLFGLTMVESQGNPASINEHDGGAGFIHTQPDVYKRFTRDFMGEEGKIFTDNEVYKKYNFKTLKNKGRSKSNIYKKHGELLEQFIRLRSMQELENVDDRFNYNKILKFASRYLRYIKEKHVLPNYKQKTLKQSRNKYKNDTEFNFIDMLMLNGFNKGPSHFTDNFGGNKNEKAGMHIVNIKNNIRAKRNYDKKLNELISQGLSGEEIINKLSIQREKIKKKDKEGLDMFKYIGFYKDAKNIIINFNKYDKKNGNKYKNIGTKNIIDLNGKNIINKDGSINKDTDIYIKVKSIFEIQDFKDSKNQLIFKGETNESDSIKGIIQKFNEWNQENGGKFINIDINKITNIKGDTLKKLTKKNKFVYIHTNIANKKN